MSEGEGHAGRRPAGRGAAAALLALVAVAVPAPAAAEFRGWRQTFDTLTEDATHSRFATQPGDSLVWRMVEEGPGGSRCLRVDASRIEFDGATQDMDIWVPLEPVADAAPGPPDSTWVLQWLWKVRDVDTSHGITLSVVRSDAGWRTPYSHQLWTDPIGSFDDPPLQWVPHAVRVDTLQSGVRVLPARESWGVVVQVAWPHKQTVWVDDIYFGPRAFAPALPQGIDAVPVLDPRDMAYGGIAGELEPGRPPILILPNRVHHRAYVYQLDRHGVPIERARELGLDDLGGGGGGALLDLDDDGDVDLVVSDDRGIKFWQNDGWNRFHRRFDALEAPMPRGSVYQVAAGDFDEDGRTDLWVVRATGPDVLLRNEGRFRFHVLEDYPLEGEAAASGDLVRRTLGDQFSVTVADFDVDGHADVFVATLGPARGIPLLLFGTGRFTFDRCTLLDFWHPGEPRVLAPYAGMPADGLETHAAIEGAAAVDVDRDGDLDLVVARDFTPNLRPAPNEILLNDGTGRFAPGPPSWMAGSIGRSEASLPGDFDNDGRVDLYEVNHGENVHLRNDGGLGLVDVTSDSPFANFSHSGMGLVADLDLDGREDVVLFEDDQALPHVRLMNNLATGGSVRVRVRGTVSGRDAVGAVLRVRAPAADGGHLLGTRQRLHGLAFGSAYWGPDAFGIGTLASCDVEVTFRSGVVRRALGVRAGDTVTVWEIRGGFAGLADRAVVAAAAVREGMRLAGRRAVWSVLGALVVLGIVPAWVRRGRRRSVALPLVWRRLFDLFRSESEHWSRNLVAVMRRAAALRGEGLDAGARAEMQALLSAALRRIRDEDGPRFGSAVVAALGELPGDDPARSDLGRFARALDELRGLADGGGTLPEARLRVLEDAASRARDAGHGLLLRAERECSLPAPAARRLALECMREGVERLGGALRDAGGDAFDGAVIADREDLRSVLVNLVRNAVEARAPHAVLVVVESRECAGRWCLRITDDGPGVDPSVRDRLFAEGVSTKGSDRGTGLEESAQAAARMHAKLELADPGGGGRGATFELSLRVARDGSNPGGSR